QEILVIHLILLNANGLNRAAAYNPERRQCSFAHFAKIRTHPMITQYHRSHRAGRCTKPSGPKMATLGHPARKLPNTDQFHELPGDPMEPLATNAERRKPLGIARNFVYRAWIA